MYGRGGKKRGRVIAVELYRDFEKQRHGEFERDGACAIGKGWRKEELREKLRGRA